MCRTTSKNESCGCTELSSNEFSYTWTIGNYGLLNLETGQSIESPTFSCAPSDATQWYLSLYPDGQKADYAEQVSVYLHLKSSTLPSVHVYYSISNILADGSAAKGARFWSHVFKAGAGRGYPKWIRHDSLLNFLVDGKLIYDVIDIKMPCSVTITEGRRERTELSTVSEFNDQYTGSTSIFSAVVYCMMSH